MPGDLLDRRLVFVTGKGGVGRTTVACALGLAAARRGRRVVVCEVARQERMSELFGREGVGPRETELRPGFSAVSIDPERALEEYLRSQVPSRALARLLFENRIFQYLAAAAPGARELTTMGKVWELAQLDRPWTGEPGRYDLVVVDAPATGHGLGMLRAPRTFAEIARVGPIRRQADRIDAFVRNRRKTGIVAVAQPEEMPVTETLELVERLGEEMGMAADLVVVNALRPDALDPGDVRALEDAPRDGSPEAAAAIAAALAERRRATGERDQLERLREALPEAVTLPRLPEPEVGLDGVERLSRELEEAL